MNAFHRMVQSTWHNYMLADTEEVVHELAWASSRKKSQAYGRAMW